ncbi:hypothetical protein PMAYCL1PPCAC_20725, partial [Pristionchus mayeri]
MEKLEKAKDRKTSVRKGKDGAQFGKFDESLIVKMSSLLSPQFGIDGLDRVKLLSQLTTPAINAIDRATPSTTELIMLASPQIHLEASEGRVVILKIHTAISAMNSFYAY